MDRGSIYAAKEFQAYSKENGFITSVSGKRKELDIEDVEYVISTDTIRRINGYEEEAFKASGLPNEDESQIEKIVFFTEGISRDINKRFPKITHSWMFEKVVRMYVKFVFIHELVQIQ